MGDLNICNKWKEKWGQKPINRRIAVEYDEFLFDLSLSKLVFSGNKFTWSNMQRGQARIMERIDKAITSVEWRMAFPNSFLQHGPFKGSDHRPLFLSLHYRHLTQHPPFIFYLRCPKRSEVINRVALQQPFLCFYA